MVGNPSTPHSPLRAARLRAGFSAEALAVKAGVSRSTLLLSEKAPMLMSERTVRLVAAALGVKPEELLP